MKTVYKYTDGNWHGEAPATEEEILFQISVPDDTDLSILNRISVYDYDGWDADLYAEAKRQLTVREAISFLASTDYIPVQWQDEEALGIEHSRSEDDYMAVLQQRQTARETIRSNQPEPENVV